MPSAEVLEMFYARAIECKPYEATMSLAVCQARRKKAIESSKGDGIQESRKCLDCPGPAETKMEESVIMPVNKCSVCGEIVDKLKCQSRQECSRCYDRRWAQKNKLRETTDTDKPAAPGFSGEEASIAAKLSTTQATLSPVDPTHGKASPTLPSGPAEPKNFARKEQAGRTLLLDFTDYPGWHEKIKAMAEEELRTPMNLIMYWIKECIRLRSD